MNAQPVTADDMRVRPQNANRKQRFRAALVLAGETVAQWTERHHVSSQHLYCVLREERVPGRALNDAIDAFIAKYLPTE